VYYAYDVLVHADHLTLADHLILHALGAAWGKPCTGDCMTFQ
jgi:hypothetical protein